MTAIKNQFLFSLVNSGINLGCLRLSSCRESPPEVLSPLLWGNYGLRGQTEFKSQLCPF